MLPQGPFVSMSPPAPVAAPAAAGYATAVPVAPAAYRQLPDDQRRRQHQQRDANHLEYVAELQYRTMCIGTPNILTDEQMAEVMERFRSYGQPGSGKAGY